MSGGARDVRFSALAASHGTRFSDIPCSLRCSCLDPGSGIPPRIAGYGPPGQGNRVVL